MARRSHSRLKHNTKGRAGLERYIDENDDRSQTSVAAELGVQQATVSFWLSGTSRPDPHYRLAMERLFKIPARDWLTREEADVAYGRGA